MTTTQQHQRTADDDTAPIAVAGGPSRRWSVSGAAKRVWMLPVVVVVVAVAAFGVYRLHGVFGSNNDVGGGKGFLNDITPFNPKHVVYEVFGPPGAVATINYLDINAQPQQALDVTLPWTYDVTTTLPAVAANLVAQGDGNSIGCRIIIDDVVKNERLVNEVGAYTFCLDKSA